MNDLGATDAVICCPACLTLYPAHNSMAGKLGKCSKCDTHFSINVMELRTDAGDPAIVFDAAIMPRRDFFREGCAEMARHVGTALRLAGLPITRDSVFEMIDSLPWDGLCFFDDRWNDTPLHEIMMAADAVEKDATDRKAFQDTVNYFVVSVPKFKYSSLYMLTNAFKGVLTLDLDPPPPLQPPARPWLVWAAIRLCEIPRRFRRAWGVLRG